MSTMFASKHRLAVAVFFVCMCLVTWSFTKTSGQARETQKSVGRGWPVPVPPGKFHGYPIDEFVGAVTPWYYQTSATATRCLLSNEVLIRSFQTLSTNH